MPIKNDWEALNGSLATGLSQLLNQMIDGTITDLDGDIRTIAMLLGKAVKQGRQDVVQACQDQLSLVVLEKGLKIKSSVGGLFDDLLYMGINALFNGAIGGLGALKVL